ncbi:RNA methyltransferase [soil metagenome]
MPVRIDSPKNQTIKDLVRLKERRHRDAQRRYLIEGTREVTRALSANIALEEIFICPEILRPEGRALVETLTLPQTEVSPDAFKRLSLRQNPDGVLGVAQMVEKRLETLTLAPDALLLVVDGVEKPGNLGALLRTADAGDLAAVFVTGAGTDLYNPNVIRASLGSVFSRPVVAVETGLLLEFLRAGGFKLIAATPDAARTYWDEDYRGGVAIVLGTEHTGLGPDWREAATANVAIPMHGLADSLNVSVAGALLVYEALRQRAEGEKR